MTDETLFAAALEKQNPAERSAFLDEACADDPAMRQRVEALLHAHDKAGDYLEQPALEQMADAAAPVQDATAALDTAGRSQPTAPPTEPAGEEADGVLAFLQPSTKPGSLGRLGHFDVVEEYGRGGFGIVLRAFDELLHRVVAIKVMAPQLAATSPARKRFLREARASAAIRHENVVAIYNVEEQPIPYLVMEFIAGETLQKKLNRVGPLDAAEVVRIGRQIAEGLAAAHAKGLIHRDIKPANILLEGGGDRVKITDFGLARAADDASLTQSGVVAGTPMYMAPEQAKGEAIDHRADLFSLGSVLYVMCSGRPPFRASTTLAVLKRVAEDAPRPIREIIPEVPEWLCAIIARLHAKKPEERFASAKDVADLLGRCQVELQKRDGVASLPELAPPAAPAPPVESSKPAAPQAAEPRRSEKPRPRWLVPTGAALLIACLLLVGFLLAYWLRPPHGSPPDPKAPVVFRVEANQPWQDTGVDVVEGEAVVLSPQGTWRKGAQTCSAAGLEGAPRERVVLPEAPVLCLLVRISDEPAPTAVLGREVFKPGRSGRLFVQANDLDLAEDGDGIQMTITGGLHTGDAVPPPAPTRIQAADRDWKPFLARAETPGTPPEQVRDVVIDYCSKYAGTPQAFRAGQRLLQAPPLVNGIGMKLVPLPPGKFLMGSPATESGHRADQGPQHEVVLTRPFFMSSNDVTVGQFKVFAKEKRYQTEAEHNGTAWRPFPDGFWKNDPQINWRKPGYEQSDDHPVVCVNWYEAQAFCAWLSDREGKKYALPTEAQWEYACRAGSQTRFYFGDDDGERAQYAWYGGSYSDHPDPVGQKKPNAWGLFDMEGNVQQWTADWYAPDYYQKNPGQDPPGPGTGVFRVLRGSNWWEDANKSRSARREGGFWRPETSATGIGLRVVLLP